MLICQVTILHQRCSILLIPSSNKNWLHWISIRSNWKTSYFNASGWRERIFAHPRNSNEWVRRRQRANWLYALKKEINQIFVFLYKTLIMDSSYKTIYDVCAHTPQHKCGLSFWHLKKKKAAEPESELTMLSNCLHLPSPHFWSGISS